MGFGNRQAAFGNVRCAFVFFVFFVVHFTTKDTKATKIDGWPIALWFCYRAKPQRCAERLAVGFAQEIGGEVAQIDQHGIGE